MGFFKEAPDQVKAALQFGRDRYNIGQPEVVSLKAHVVALEKGRLVELGETRQFGILTRRIKLRDTFYMDGTGAGMLDGRSKNEIRVIFPSEEPDDFEWSIDFKRHSLEAVRYLKINPGAYLRSL